jgi:hypothetical protein
MNEDTASAETQLLILRQTARQLVFRTGIDGTPVAIGGTYFIVSYSDRLFAITAKHVVGDALPEQLLLTTSDKSLVPARILEQINPFDGVSGDVDLVVYDLDIRHFSVKQRRNSRACHLTATEPSWRARCHESSYFVFGYPLKHASVHYGVRTTQTNSQQWFLEGRYKCPSEVPNCHMLMLCDTQRIEDLNGLSGSPVFALPAVLGVPGLPIFAGIALRGSATAKLLHFLEGDAVRTILDHIVSRPRKNLPKRWLGAKTRERRRPKRHE